MRIPIAALIGLFLTSLYFLVAIFAPLMGLVLVPLVLRIRREQAEASLQPSAPSAAAL